MTVILIHSTAKEVKKARENPQSKEKKHLNPKSQSIRFSNLSQQ